MSGVVVVFSNTRSLQIPDAVNPHAFHVVESDAAGKVSVTDPTPIDEVKQLSVSKSFDERTADAGVVVEVQEPASAMFDVDDATSKPSAFAR